MLEELEVSLFQGLSDGSCGGVDGEGDCECVRQFGGFGIFVEGGGVGGEQ